ncbi:MAG TPA: AI-2E family transporter, partial [Tepidisphaeraceae bacterium]
LFTLFYLLRDNHKIGIAVTNVLPLDDQQAQDVFHRCEEIIRASVQGVIFIAAIQGAMGGLAFWVLGVKPALLWGVVMFVMSMIPALGAFIVWVPAAIYLLATGQYWQGAALALWGGLAIGSIDNFLRPRLVGQKTGMHDLVIFFSVLGGLQVFGILGLFVGPVVVAVALSIVEVFREATGTGKSTGDRVVVVEAATVIMPPTETSRPAETMALPDAPR